MNPLPVGLWPVMISPFNDQNNIDLKGLDNLIEFYISSGSSGLFANCLSSEMYQLSYQERLQLVQNVVKFSANRVPVVATGSFWKNSNENVEFIKKIYDSGVSAVILITSILVEPDESEDILKTKLEDIMNKTEDIPLGVYECPVPYKRLLSTNMLKWMAGTNRFFYHKDTSCHSLSLKNKIEAVSGTNFNVYNADTATALDSMQAGAKGISPISANFYPELYTFLWKEFSKNGISDSLMDLHAILTIMDRFTHTFYPYSAKWFLKNRGLKISTYSRISSDFMSDLDILRFKALDKTFNFLTEKYGIKKTIF
jgi:4-hydroxy-tetrahydrodipicolinate synthase